ncbi:MAG TPA: hypothetical protein VL122_00350 [Nitrospirota bacterium]|nr:hypothetical protein [Nitrospirota bacterium]
MSYLSKQGLMPGLEFSSAASAADIHRFIRGNPVIFLVTMIVT